MYSKIKFLVQKLIPRSWLLKNETLLRRFISIFFKGNRQICNLCNYKLRKFALTNHNEKICPNCGSLPRTRLLAFILDVIIDPKDKVLHFSPSKKISQILNFRLGSQYLTSDYEKEFEATHNFDIQDINLPNESMDKIICFHILEHIPDDQKAINELFRILKSGGVALIQTPFKSGAIYEDLNIKTEKLREIHFGQKDHVRIYSVKGLKNRLEKAGLIVHIYNQPVNSISEFYGLSTNPVLYALKQQ